MAGQWPKVVRDPIHNLIRFDDTELDRLLLELIDCREFQRLRRIKQLGFSDTVFPGATHTRFAHSIGVMWNVKRLVRRLERLDPSLVDKEHRYVVLVAALLHDIGHGPFSHAFEKVTGGRHEERTVEILLDESSEVHRALARRDPGFPHRVGSLFEEGAELIDESALHGYECPGYLQSLVSSQFDGDRWDYLLRDSHFTGTEYGRFDVDWLIEHLEVDREKDRLYLTRKAHHAVEGYVFARYHMYQAVYFHKATRASEVMLRLLFDRYKQLIMAADSDEERKAVVTDAPSSVRRAFQSEIPLDEFLLLDDHSITQFLKAATDATDPTIAYLANGLLNRKLYKCIDVTDASRDEPDHFGSFAAEASQEVSRAPNVPVEPESAFVSDKPSDTPYKIYDPDADNPATQIYVQRETGALIELSRISGQVDALKKKVALLRYYFPLELRDLVDPVAKKHLQRRTA